MAHTIEGDNLPKDGAGCAPDFILGRPLDGPGATADRDGAGSVEGRYRGGCAEGRFKTAFLSSVHDPKPPISNYHKSLLSG